MRPGTRVFRQAVGLRRPAGPRRLLYLDGTFPGTLHELAVRADRGTATSRFNG